MFHHGENLQDEFYKWEYNKLMKKLTNKVIVVFSQDDYNTQ